jgi:DNA adenine methylase
MRFNGKGGYNVPFGHKPGRFRQAYITKICNQVRWLAAILENKDWEFKACNWKETVLKAKKEDFIYMDPPYFGRHTDYYNHWTEEDAVELSRIAQSRDCGFALSMWKENKYRKNHYIDDYWPECIIRTFSHFYHVGSTQSLRNEMQEALVIKRGFAAEAGEAGQGTI